MQPSSSNQSSAFRRTQSLRFPKGRQSPLTCGLDRKGSKRISRGRPSSNKSPNEVQTLSLLSPSQRIALIQSWRVLKPQVLSLVRRILAEMEVVSPKVKDIFNKAAVVECWVNREPGTNATLDEHVKLIAKLFDDIVTQLDFDESELTGIVKGIGQRHALLNQRCGFSADIWEQFGEISVGKICSTDAVQKTREAGRAWRAIIAFVTDQLRCGFDGEAKYFSRRPSVDDQGEEDESNGDGECAHSEGLTRQLKALRLEYESTVDSPSF